MKNLRSADSRDLEISGTDICLSSNPVLDLTRKIKSRKSKRVHRRMRLGSELLINIQPVGPYSGSLEARVKNISISGCCFSVELIASDKRPPLEEGDILYIFFDNASSESTCRIVRIYEINARLEIGVEWISFGDQTKKRIQNITGVSIMASSPHVVIRKINQDKPLPSTTFWILQLRTMLERLRWRDADPLDWSTIERDSSAIPKSLSLIRKI